MDTRLYLRNTLKLEQGGTGTCCLALWCFRQLRFIRLQAFVGVYRCHKYRRHICHLRQSMELPEPQTFVRRRRTRGQHPRASLESSGASARSPLWQDGFRAQHNRIVGRYLQEGHHTRRGSSQEAPPPYTAWVPAFRQSISLPEPQTFVRRRQTRGQHPRASLESSGASARSSLWQDGLLGPAFRRLQAVDARAQYNRMVGRYLQEAHYTPRGSSVLERGFLEDFEWMSTMQVDSSEHPDRVTRQQVLQWISSEGLEAPQYDLLDLPDQNEC